MARPLLIAMIAGATSALLSAAFLTGGPGMMVVANLAPLPLFIVGLGLGSAATAIASLAGIGLTMIAGGAVVAGMYTIVHALPAWLAVRQSLRSHQRSDGSVAWYPAGHVLCWITTLAAVFVVVFALTGTVGETGLEESVRRYLNEVVGVLAANAGEADRARLVAGLLPFFPGTVGISWIALILINGLLAQAILTRAGRNLRPRPRLETFRLAGWFSWLWVAAAAAALLAPNDFGYMGRNLTMILAVPFFVLGTAVVHFLAHRTPTPRPTLVLYYVMAVLFFWVRFAAAGLGMVEDWFGIRRRFPGWSPPAEEE